MPRTSSQQNHALSKVYSWFSSLVTDDAAALEALVAQGFPIDTLHPLRHTTALMEATRLGRTATVRWLLERGAAPALLCGLPIGSPLHCAIRRGHWDCAELLIIAMDTTHLRDAYGRTPLHLLAMEASAPLTTQSILPLAEMLIAKKCLTESLDHEGTSALHHCAINDAPELANLLLKQGADVNILIPDTRVSPLMIAALEQNMNMVGLLLHYGADPYLPTRDGVTPISVMPTILRMVGHRALGLSSMEHAENPSGTEQLH